MQFYMLNRSAFVNLRLMKIKIFIISLVRCTDRRERIAERLYALNIPFEFINAVDAQALSAEETHTIQTSQRARRDYGRTIGSTEIACAFSHLKAYQAVHTHGLDGAIILEDDAIIDEQFAPFVNWLTQQETVPKGLWLLGGGEYLEKQVVKNYFDFSILAKNPAVMDSTWGKLFQIECCFDKLARACGYFIDAQTALALRNYNNPPAALADDWPFFIHNGCIQSAYICQPYLIQHPIEINGQSLLQAERALPQGNAHSKKKLSTLIKERLGYYQALYRIKVCIHQLKHRVFR